MAILPVFGDKMALGVVLEGEDEVMLCYLTSTMTTSKPPGNSMYVIWLRFFDGGRAAEVGMWWRRVLAD